MAKYPAQAAAMSSAQIRCCAEGLSGAVNEPAPPEPDTVNGWFAGLDARLIDGAFVQQHLNFRHHRVQWPQAAHLRHVGFERSPVQGTRRSTLKMW